MTSRRKDGDLVSIPGDYQHRAMTVGNAVQRFWHVSKQLAILRQLPPEPGDRVLDVGCGSGNITAMLAARCRGAVGVDGNPEAIRFARATYRAHNLEFVEGQVDQIGKIGGPFDKVYCLEVVEHVYSAQGLAMVRLFRDLLKPGGWAFITTPNYRSLWPLIEWLMDRSGRAPRMADDQHVAHYTAASIAALVRAAGLTVSSVRTCCLAAPWLAPVSWRLAERVDDVEWRLPLHPGSILTVVSRKPLGADLP